MADTETFIAQLAGQATPVKPAAHPFRILAQWLIGAALYVGFLVAYSHPRPDLFALLLHQPLFAAEIITLIALIASALLSAVLYSYPDVMQKPRLARLPFVIFGLFILVMAAELFNEPAGTPMPEHEMLCTLCITLYAVIPATAMFHRMRRQATTHAGAAGAIAVLAAFSMGALILRLVEFTDSVRHVVLMHYAPMFIAAAIGMWLGQKLFRW